jgi:hypothetical protein
VGPRAGLDAVVNAVDLIYLAQNRPMAVFCEHDKEALVSITLGEFLDWTCDYKRLRTLLPSN